MKNKGKEDKRYEKVHKQKIIGKQLEKVTKVFFIFVESFRLLSYRRTANKYFHSQQKRSNFSSLFPDAPYARGR